MSERLCVVMPVYNEREAIASVLGKWAKSLDALEIDYALRPYNDGSKDDSLAVMRATAKSLPRVEVRDKPNGGHGNTILTGYLEAAADGFDWVFQVDSDDEMGPEKFAELWARRADFDFLVGIRDGRVQQLPRKVISFVSRLCVRLFYGKSVWDVNTPYRLMRVSAFREFFGTIPLSTFAPNVILSGLAARHGLRCHEIRVPQHDRRTGEVSIKRWKLAKAAVRSFRQTVAFALRPKSASWLSRGILGAIAVWGMSFSLFLMLSPWRFGTVAIGLLLMAVFRRTIARLLSAAGRFVAAHPFGCLAGVLALGLAERFAFATAFPDFVDQTAFATGGEGLDWTVLWDGAVQCAGGVWKASKSWTLTLLYGGYVSAFGARLEGVWLLNAAVNFATSLTLFALVGRWFGRSAGVVAATLHFCLPYFALHSLNVATEHLYGLFVVLGLLFLDRALAARTVLRTLADGLGFVFVSWLCVWSRGEGLLLLVTGLAGAVLVTGLCNRRWGLCGVLCVTIVSVSLLAGGFACRVNQLTDGTSTVFCSNDNLWPRLFGTNVSAGGRVNGEDIEFILARYQQDHPENVGRPPLRELTPYLKDETVRRWREMPLGTMVCFVVRKEWEDWNWDTMRMRPSLVSRLLVKALRVPFSALYVACSLVFWWLFLVSALRGRLATTGVVTIAILLAGDVAVLAMSECNYRYGYLLPLLFPVFVAGLTARRPETGRENG